MTQPVLAASEYGGPFEVPPIGDLFNFRPIVEIGGGLLDINRVVLITLTSMLITMGLFYLAFSKPKVVPGKLQTAAEAVVGFIRDSVAVDIIGPEGRRYAPFLTSLFMFIWLNNLFEIIPGVSFPATSKIALPMFLAVVVWLTFIILGMRTQGPISYFKELIIPPGVPKVMLVLIAPIEFISNIVVRPITLTVRLFANMVAGHILLTIVFLAINSFLVLGPGLPVGIVVLLVSPLAVGFELFVGLLQAYIFVILTSVYISGSLHPAH